MCLFNFSRVSWVQALMIIKQAVKLFRINQSQLNLYTYKSLVRTTTAFLVAQLYLIFIRNLLI